MTWKKIIIGKMSDEIDAKLGQIATSLCQVWSETKKDNVGLLGGMTGITLFLYYYSRYKNDETFANTGFEILSNIFDTINEGFSYHTFCSGLGGIAWTVDLLVREKLLEADLEDTISGLDNYLKKIMLKDMKEGNYDFLHGAIGNGLYFLTRAADHKKYRHFVHQLVDELDEKADKGESQKAKWLTMLDHEKKTMGYNLSLSHGQASIIGFLQQTAEAKIHLGKVLPLLEYSVNYLLANRLDVNKFPSHFPSWIEPGQAVNPSRLAWCYGDLGIAITLYQAAITADRKDWKKIAVEVMDHTLKRRDPKKEAVIDACICHGASGVAHIYNRMFQYTGQKEFKEAAVYWLKDTLAKATFADGLAGYKSWHTEQYGGWQNETSILEGIAGIGLAFLAAVSNIEPKWDKALLLS